MEWNIEENFSMEWKIFGMEWNQNGRKLLIWNTGMEKSSSNPYHALVSSTVGCNVARLKTTVLRDCDFLVVQGTCIYF